MSVKIIEEANHDENELIPEEHKNILRERIIAYEAGTEATMSLEEVKKHFLINKFPPRV